MRCAIYIRVSTIEQTENYSISAQKERLEAYCKAKGWTIYDNYIDGGYSGSNTERPALQKLLNDLNQFDVVAVYRLDRLSRSQRDTLTLIEDHFLKNDVDFVSITETLDTSTPFGKAMIGILSVFAQLERETIAERMRMGHIKRAEEGYRVSGGDYDPSGYTRQDGDLVIVEEERDHIKLVFDLYEQYHSISKVQKHLKMIGQPVWRFRRYNDILQNRLYCGYVSFAGEYYKGRHEAIITEEQFERVQVLRNRHPGKNANKAKESLLSGLITCGSCGELYHTYTAGKHPHKYRYYICRARRFPSEYDEKCFNKTWSSKQLETLVIDQTIEYLQNKQLGEEKKKTKAPDFTKLIKKVDSKIERLLDLYMDGNVEKELLDKQIQKLNDEKQELVNQMNLNDQLETTLTPEKIQELSIDLQASEFNVRQSVVQKLIRQITIHDKEISIEWNV